MPEGDVVVSDTSPLLNLAFIDRLELLEAQFDVIEVPKQVWDELGEGDDMSQFETLRERGNSGWCRYRPDRSLHRDRP